MKTWRAGLAGLFLVCSGVLLVVAALPLEHMRDLIPLTFGFVQIGATVVAISSTMALRWLDRRAVAAEAEIYTRMAAKTRRDL